MTALFILMLVGVVALVADVVLTLIMAYLDFKDRRKKK